jgi:hypothetical protein
MKITYSNHAMQQMKLRSISMDLVEKVMDSPDEIIKFGTLTIYQAIIDFGEKKEYLVRVFVNKEKEPALVVTIYKTSKIKKYYEGEI